MRLALRTGDILYRKHFILETLFREAVSSPIQYLEEFQTYKGLLASFTLQFAK